MEVKFCDTSAYPVRDQVFSLVNERFNEGIQYRAQLENDTAHWQANKPRMESEDKPVESLFGSRPGANVIVATSGPSLDGQLEWLRGHRDTSILVTVNSSLRTLMRAGIVPDYVVVIDSNEIIAKDLDTLEVEPLKSSTLVYEPVVTPKLVQAWPGPRCYSVNKVLWASGSVLHPAVDLAVKLGAKSVTLLGADFCYVSNRYYTTGAANKVPIMPDVAASMPTFDGNGNETSTQPSLARYHRHLERYIAEHPEVQWFKRGRKGVEIRGAQWLD
jgi:hypothetical protein